MPNLERFIREHQTIPETKDLSQFVRSFDALIDFLRKPETLPNQDINESVTLMWRLIGKKEIPVVLDQWGFPSISFAVFKKDNEECPLLIVPQDFPSQVKENPVFQLGIIAYMSSQARDFYTGRIKGNNSEEINARARAFEAEALLTLKKMAENEGITLHFNDFQKGILEQFPEGFGSLPAGAKYPTPIYFPTRVI